MSMFKEPIVLYRKIKTKGFIKGIKCYMLELKDLKFLGYF